MKPLFAFAIFAMAGPNLAQASGYSCTSNCMVVDFENQQIYALGNVSYRADIDLAQAFQNLNQVCATRASQWGLNPHLAVLTQSIHFTTTTSTYRDYRYFSSRTFGKKVIFEENTSYHSRGLSADWNPEDEKACHPDSSIEPGTLPYVGNLPVLG